MSVTGHNPVRRPDDYYATPPWCTRAILHHLRKSAHVLDPCAGDGAILRTVYEEWWPQDVALLRGFEINWERAEMSKSLQVDALKIPWHHPDDELDKPGLILTNPPYYLSMEFVDKALKEVSPTGTVAMLLRLAWLSSQKRAPWLRKHTPSIYVLPKRPSFTGSGTDSTDYAWFVWDRMPPTVKILEV